MKYLLPFLALTLLAFPGRAQGVFHRGWEIWTEHHQNNFQQTADGGYILCTDALPEMDSVSNLPRCYLLKLNAQGTQQWIVEFPKSTYFQKAADGNSVVQTSDGGYAVATAMYSISPTSFSARSAIYVVKVSAAGTLLWSRTYPGIGTSLPHCISEAANSDLLIAGQTIDTSAFAQHAYLLRLNSTGNVVWGKHYVQPAGGPGGVFHSVAETSDNGLIVSGSIGGVGLVMKTDGTGNILWTNQPGNLDPSESYHVIEASDGHFVCAGLNYVTQGQATLVKMDANGGFVWGYSYPRQTATSGEDAAFSVVEVADGYTFSIHNSTAMRAGLVHVDTAGQPVWANLYKNTYSPYPVDLAHTTDNGYAFCASYRSMNPQSTWLVGVVKVNAAGKAPCNDSVVVDTAIAMAPTIPMPLVATSHAPAIPISTVLYPKPLPKTNLCASIAVEDVAASPYSVSVYPNPANHEVYVSLSGLSGNAVTIRLYNSTGQEVQRIAGGNVVGTCVTPLSTAALPAGLYFVSVEPDGQRVRTERLVIEH